MKTIDNHICGDNDPNAPFNQVEIELDNRTIEELINDNEIEKALSLLSEIRLNISRCREVSKTIENYYLKNQLSDIYNKI